MKKANQNSKNTDLTPSFTRRLTNLRTLMSHHACDAALIASQPTITYLTGYGNFSIEEREAYVLVFKDNVYLFTDQRYNDASTTIPAHITCIMRKPAQTLLALVTDFLKNQAIETLGIEKRTLTLAEYEILSGNFHSFVDLPTYKIRMQKDTYELFCITQACQIADKALQSVIAEIKVGISEADIALLLEITIKKHGGDISFKPIVAFGVHSAIPHYQTGNTHLTQAQSSFILIDFGAKINNYCSDMTRTLFLGQATQLQKHLYDTVLQAQAKAVSYIESQLEVSSATLTGKTVDKIARDCISKAGYPTIPHGLGHAIGLEVHEKPFLTPLGNDILSEGAVFTIEPGIYDSEQGGVRIEDMYTIENNTLRRLTQFTHEILVI